MGKKYIIELPENTHWIQWIMEGTGDHHPYMDFKQVEDLTHYTEPDIYAVRKEAFDDGYQEGMQLSIDDAKLKEEYRRGLDDAWGAARTLWNTPNRKEIFGYTTFNTALTTLTGQEALEKIRQYEQENEEIQVGDEVKCIRAGWTAVVTKIKEGCMTLMGNDGAVAYSYDEKDFIKTGRHFPEIAEVLRKMKEES